MSKINKIYSAFFNGVSQQNAELALDNQCREMTNCIPDIVRGIKKRPPAKLVGALLPTTNPNITQSQIFHSYDRGEDDEEYYMMSTGNSSDPVRVYNKAGTEMTVTYDGLTEASCKAYLSAGNLRGLTVQDRTWLYSRNKTITVDKSLTTPLSANYDRVAYYWIKRGSGDRFNPFNYAVYLDSTTFAVDPVKPDVGGTSSQNPPTGAEDSDKAAELLAAKINANASWTCTRVGSILKIVKVGGGDFTYSSWDSWGNQASEGWKESVNRIAQLPQDMPFDDTYVRIAGSEGNRFTDYFVKWTGSSWEECLDPKADRGLLTDMPLRMDRISLSNGIATFYIDQIDWSPPRVGNEENNSDPSFVGRKVTDLFFYKNRLGITSDDSITLTEAANYRNFYVSTAIDTVTTDTVDLTVSTNQASNIYFAKPFNNSLYIFTKYAQYEVTNEGPFGPNTVSVESVTNYPMKTDVEPVVMNNSLYFISVSNNRQQLREYVKADNLSVQGVDLNIATPTYIEKPVTALIADGVIGIVMCCTNSGTAYVYNYKDDGSSRIQSAWSTWELFEGITPTSVEWTSLGTSVGIWMKRQGNYVYHQLFLDDKGENNRFDQTYDDTLFQIDVPYKSSVTLPDYYPQLIGTRTPLNKVLIKRVVVEGDGEFESSVYRKDYDVTYTKQHALSLKDGDFYVNSKVGNVDIAIYDDSVKDFTISSVVIEGLFQPSSQEIK
jgi:uncharacterized protein YcnI